MAQDYGLLTRDDWKFQQDKGIIHGEIVAKILEVDNENTGTAHNQSDDGPFRPSDKSNQDSAISHAVSRIRLLSATGE